MTALWQLAIGIGDGLLKEPLAKAESSSVQGYNAVDWWHIQATQQELRWRNVVNKYNS